MTPPVSYAQLKGKPVDLQENRSIYNKILQKISGNWEKNLIIEIDYEEIKKSIGHNRNM